jgi:hypothetical protein
MIAGIHKEIFDAENIPSPASGEGEGKVRSTLTSRPPTEAKEESSTCSSYLKSAHR